MQNGNSGKKLIINCDNAIAMEQTRIQLECIARKDPYSRSVGGGFDSWSTHTFRGNFLELLEYTTLSREAGFAPVGAFI